ncbi:MAG: hypothetical protein J5891_07720 [Spirochaetales bacterium]|nr:hypothetical protein [Spirochaetales bacterium]
MIKKYFTRGIYALLALVLLVGCTKTAGPSESAVSSIQMTDYNAQLELQPSVGHNRTTYEIFVYSFCDSDRDGIGDINGIREKLDYIQDLGCDRIWLTPVSPSTTYHKYDVIDYYGIDPEFGTMEDYEALLKECHERGMEVYFDLVLNHSSSKCEWFTQAVDYLHELPADWRPDSSYCPYFAYYNFSRDAQNGYAPLEGTNWYYEARFWSEMPDLNLDSEAVREEIKNIMYYWMDKGVDGFRLDAVTSYYTGNNPKNAEFLRWLCDTARRKDPEVYFVGEAWTDRQKISELYTSGIDSLFNFPFADSTGIIRNVVNGSYSVKDYVAAIISSDSLYRQSNPGYTDAPFYTNHDIARSAGYYASDKGPKTKMAYALSMLMGGNSFIYYGEELGMKGSGRDENKRAPMYWSTDPSAEGMCAGPRDMETVAMKFASLEEQEKDEESVYSFIRQAIRVRRAFPVIACGFTDLAEPSTDSMALFTKEKEGFDTVLIAVNLSSEAQSADISATGFDTLSAVLNTSEEKITLENGTLTLPSFSIAVLTGGQ